MLITFLRALIFAWPFIKELLLGSKDQRTGARKNTMSTVMILAIVIIFTLFLYVAASAVKASGEIRDLGTKNKLLELQLSTAQNSCGKPGAGELALHEMVSSLEASVKECRESSVKDGANIVSLGAQNSALVTALTAAQANSVGNSKGTNKPDFKSKFKRLHDEEE